MMMLTYFGHDLQDTSTPNREWLQKSRERLGMLGRCLFESQTSNTAETPQVLEIRDTNLRIKLLLMVVGIIRCEAEK